MKKLQNLEFWHEKTLLFGGNICDRAATAAQQQNLKKKAGKLTVIGHVGIACTFLVLITTSYQLASIYEYSSVVVIHDSPHILAKKSMHDEVFFLRHRHE